MLCNRSLDREFHFALDASKVPEVRRQYDPNHGSV